MKSLFTALLLVSLSSAGQAEEALTPVVIKESLRIPTEQIPALEKRANQGDREAAMKLATYYGVYLNDRNKQLHYYRLAAKNGSEVALKNLIYIFATFPEFFDSKKAIALRERLKKLALERNFEVETDADWGYDLYVEHFVGRGSKKRGLFFLEYAAKHGSEKARDELVEIYSNDPDVRDSVKARKWKDVLGK